MSDFVSVVDSSISSNIIAETIDTADQLNVIHNDLNLLIFLFLTCIALCLSAVVFTVVYKILSVFSYI